MTRTWDDNVPMKPHDDAQHGMKTHNNYATTAYNNDMGR